MTRDVTCGPGGRAGAGGGGAQRGDAAERQGALELRAGGGVVGGRGRDRDVQQRQDGQDLEPQDHGQAQGASGPFVRVVCPSCPSRSRTVKTWSPKIMVMRKDRPDHVLVASGPLFRVICLNRSSRSRTVKTWSPKSTAERKARPGRHLSGSSVRADGARRVDRPGTGDRPGPWIGTSR